MQRLVAIVALFVLVAILGCGSGYSKIDFEIVPSALSIMPGETRQLTTTNAALIGKWSLSDSPGIGQISSSGLYRAPTYAFPNTVAHVSFSYQGVTRYADILIKNPVPQITSIDYVFRVDGSILANISGTGFLGNSIVESGNTVVISQAIDSTHIQAQLVGMPLVSQTLALKVVNPGLIQSNIFALQVDPPKLKSIAISGVPSFIVSDTPSKIVVTALYGNGETVDVTSRANYIYDSSIIANIAGSFACNHSGNVTITSSFGDPAASASVNTTCVIRSPHQVRGPVEHFKTFEGPFNSWINVVKDFGALGDGLHDDTVAIQNALNAALKSHAMVYLPNGIYRISQTLTVKNIGFYSVIGQDPLSTEILWDGPDNGTMFMFGGTVHFSIGRLRFNGQSRAQVGIQNTWTTGGYYPTKNRIHDVQIVDVAVGIRNDFAGETTVDRAHFRSNSQAAIALTNFNALNFNVIDSIFEDCNVGATNTLWNGAGAFNIVNSIFLRSKKTDIAIGNTGSFLLKSNISIDSTQFLIEGETSNASTITMQNNQIYHSKKVPVDMRNLGPLTLIDNLFQALDEKSPIVSVPTGTPGVIFAIGNRYATSTPYVGKIRNLKTFDETPNLVPNDPPVAPTEVYVPQRMAKNLIEIPIGSGSRGIQQAIDRASVEPTVIHFPVGRYIVDSSIRIPTGKNLHLLGDTPGSVISPASDFAGSIFSVEGGQVEMENLMINGNVGPATAITVSMKDDPSTHIIVDETDINSLQDKTSLGITHPGADYLSFESKVLSIDSTLGIDVKGGDLQKAHQGNLARISYFVGGTGYYEVGSSGELLVEGAFHDFGNGPRAFTVSGDAKVSHQSGIIFTNSFSGNTLSNFSGTLALIGLPSDTQILATASNSGNVLFAGSVLSRTDGGVIVPDSNNPSLWSISSLALDYSNPTHLRVMPDAQKPSALDSAFAFARSRYMGYRSQPIPSSDILRLSGMTIWSIHKAIEIRPAARPSFGTDLDIVRPSSPSCPTSNLLMGVRLVPDGDGSYAIRTSTGFLSESSSNHSISVVSDSTSAFERWFVEPAANGTFQISNRATSYSLAQDDSGCPAARVIEGGDASGWQIIPK